VPLIRMINFTSFENLKDKKKQARGDMFKKREMRIILNPRPSAFSIHIM